MYHNVALAPYLVTTTSESTADRPAVTLITGAERHCGIMDYTSVLQPHLQEHGIDARITVVERTDLRALPHIYRQLLGGSGRPPVLHLQYPLAQSNGLSLYLLACDLRAPFMVTLHEYSAVRELRQRSFLVFALAARGIFFTTEEERARFLQRFPWSARKTRVVPIGSNIPFRSHRAEPGTPRIVMFSLIRPNKGLEQFIEVARLAAAAGLPYRFQVIGARISWHREYVDSLLASSRDCPIDWQFDLSTPDVSRTLSRAHAAYLPFPDGASERRGSLLAVMGNGVPTVTTRGPATPRLEGALAFADSSAEALARLREIVSVPERAQTLGEAGRRYVERFSWDRIAAEHAAVYRSIGTARSTA